ncbi:MAG: glycosyltransferase [Candidatus Thermoplasmatota archaeon]|jgi:glycosyltransferase involved in cell wall biosynthesis
MTGLRVAMLAPHARTFIQGLATGLAPHLDHLDLWVRHNRVVDWAAGLPWPHAKAVGRKYGARVVLGEATWPSNVDVRLASIAYLRRDGVNPGLGKRLGRRWSSLLASDPAPDLLHGQFLHPQGVAAAKAAERLGTKLVLTGHGFDVYDLPRRSPRWAALAQATLAQADEVITVSQRNAALLRDLGVDAARLTVIPNGYDSRRFHPRPRPECRQRLGLPEKGPIVACVGNLEPVKGQDLLVEAFRTVHQTYPGARLVLIGGGSMEPVLQAMVVRLGLGDVVQFVGPRPHDEIPDWLNAVDLVVLPSRDEGNPTLLAEALGCGVPVVATRVGGVPDILSNEFLVAPEDPAGLAESILATLAGQRRRPTAKRDLRWETLAAETAQVYGRAVRRS